jgi:hypothetical protein
VRGSAWPSYLDALETYLQRVSASIDRGERALRPPALASRPVGPPPPQLAGRAAALLLDADRLVVRAALRRDDVLSSLQVLEGRRRTSRPVASRVEWAL